MWNNPQRRILRHMHFVANQRGIINRYIRESEGWKKHLQKTRNFILDYALSLPNKDHLVIMGSGWLLDVPLEELAGQFSRITLADIYHPPQIRHKIRKYTNVDFVETDLTGGCVEMVYRLVKEHRHTPLDKLPDPPIPVTSSMFNLVPGTSHPHLVSVNLLSQLDIMLADYLTKKIGITPDKLLPFRKAIQQAHIKFLSAHSPSCLVTDWKEVMTPISKGNTIENRVAFADIPEGKINRTWNWTFDTTGSYRKGYAIEMRVRAIVM